MTLRSPVVWFPALALGVYAFAAWVGARLSGWDEPDLLAWAITFDLVVSVPLLFHLLVGRPRGYPVLRTVPLAVIGFVVARLVLPEGHRDPLPAAELLLFPLELALIGWVVLRMRRAFRAGAAVDTLDPLERLRAATVELTGNARLAGFLTLELAMVRYAFARRGEPPHVPEGSRAFTQHVESGHGGLVFGVLMLLAVEGLAVHFLLAKWSHLLAWIFTLSTVYVALWMFADWRATVLRPLLVEDDALRIRAGLRWHGRVDRAAVVALHDATAEPPKRERVEITFLSGPTRWLELREPATLEGPFGTRKTARWIGLAPDDPSGLAVALRGDGQ
jgi:hypothetical protein